MVVVESTTTRKGRKMAADQDKYNGWTNYETWLVNLHFSNDQGIYGTIVEDIVPEVEESDSETPRVDLADRLKALAEELTIDYIDAETDGWQPPQSLLIIDMLRAAIGRVDWMEIAAAWLEAAAEVNA